MDDTSYRKHLDGSLHFLSFRPRSEKEVRDNLRGKHASNAIIEAVITYLKDQRYVNDEDFVKWWIEQRARFRQKGMRVIKMELKQKGIAAETIEDVLSGLSAEDDKSQMPNEVDMAKKIVEQKIGKYKGLPRREIYQKLGAALSRRGFNWDTIKSSIDEVLEIGV